MPLEKLERLIGDALRQDAEESDFESFESNALHEVQMRSTNEILWRRKKRY